jgi:hypothetical protein
MKFARLHGVAGLALCFIDRPFALGWPLSFRHRSAALARRKSPRAVVRATENRKRTRHKRATDLSKG